MPANVMFRNDLLVASKYMCLIYELGNWTGSGGRGFSSRAVECFAELEQRSCDDAGVELVLVTSTTETVCTTMPWIDASASQQLDEPVTRPSCHVRRRSGSVAATFFSVVQRFTHTAYRNGECGERY